MKIVVTRSRPKDDQEGIEHLIGKVFDAEVDSEGNATVHSDEFGGQVILQSDEWRPRDSLSAEALAAQQGKACSSMIDHYSISQIDRVAFLNALREIVGRRRPRNKSGAALVSDYDLLWSSDDERAEAWRRATKAY